MRIRPLLVHAGILGLALLSVQALHVKWLKSALGQQDQAQISRLLVSVAGALNEAHRTNDDLALIKLLNGLAQGPGILQAFVIDSDNRIIAHRQPAQLGRLVSLPPNGSGIFLFPLRQGPKEWGRLVLAISDRLNQQLVRRQALDGTVAAILLWGFLLFYLQMLERRTSLLQVQMAELGGLLQAERRKWSTSQERERLSALQASACLSKAIEGIPKPLMVLDLHQRIAAANRAALSCLRMAESDVILRKSWQEIPALAAAGSGLEHSLASPGQPVDWTAENGDFRLSFETDKDNLAGTWITFEAIRYRT